jgi:ATP-dependent DNA helicase RecG
MKMEFGEIQSGFLSTVSYTKQKVSLVENDEGENVGANVGINGGVNGGVNTILTLVENNPGINVLTMMKHFNVSQRTIERWINQLKKENKIEFKGVPKTGGYWKVKD